MLWAGAVYNKVASGCQTYRLCCIFIYFLVNRSSRTIYFTERRDACDSWNESAVLVKVISYWRLHHRGGFSSLNRGGSLSIMSAKLILARLAVRLAGKCWPLQVSTLILEFFLASKHSVNIPVGKPTELIKAMHTRWGFLAEAEALHDVGHRRDAVTLAFASDVFRSFKKSPQTWIRLKSPNPCSPLYSAPHLRY